MKCVHMLSVHKVIYFCRSGSFIVNLEHGPSLKPSLELKYLSLRNSEIFHSLSVFDHFLGLVL